MSAQQTTTAPKQTENTQFTVYGSHFTRTVITDSSINAVRQTHRGAGVEPAGAYYGERSDCKIEQFYVIEDDGTQYAVSVASASPR